MRVGVAQRVPAYHIPSLSECVTETQLMIFALPLMQRANDGAFKWEEDKMRWEETVIRTHICPTFCSGGDYNGKNNTKHVRAGAYDRLFFHILSR